MASDFEAGPVFALGSQLPADSFRDLSKYLRREGALQSRHVKDDASGLELTTPVTEGLVDVESGEDCWLKVAGDGRVRCLPSFDYGFIEYFTDPECTSPVIDESRYERAVENGNPYYPGGQPLLLATTLDGRTRIFEIGESYEGPLYVFYEDAWLKTDRTCEARGSTQESSVWYSAGAEMSPQRFVEYELTVVD